ncbi:MAG: ion transporter [Nannocystaceae bacterium]|nr:ion transporter [Nannocystaceae bacterium]
MTSATQAPLGEDEPPEVSPRARFAHELGRFLDAFTVRLLLSVAIIVSLMPVEFGLGMDVLFLGVFGTEFFGRCFVLAYGRSGQDAGEDVEAGEEAPRSRVGAAVLLLVDFVALVSFVPLPVNPASARWLRLFRLTRMLLLVGYWAPLVRDVWAILSRRERMRQIALMGFVVGGLSFAGAVFLHYVGGTGVDSNSDGVLDSADEDFLMLLWWAFRQVQDPGNIVQTPHALPLLVTSVALTVFGLFLVSFLIGLGTDVVRELLERMQLRPPGLSGHTVIINITPSTRRLLHELMRYYRRLLPTDARFLSLRWFSDLRQRGLTATKYLVVGRGDEPPDFLRQPELSKIVYRERSEEDEMLIARADLLSARRIVLLADPDEASPDAATIKTLLTFVERIAEREQRHPALKRANQRRMVIAEILDESNVAAARTAVRTGSSSFRAFVVPTERLLALFIAGVVRRPGLGHLLQELLTSHGHELYTCFFHTDGLGFVLDTPPELGRDYAAVMRRLLADGMSRAHRGAPAVIPLGLLVGTPEASALGDFEVTINPVDADGSQDVIGFVAIADGFRTVRDFAEGLADQAVPHDGGAGPELPKFRVAKSTEIRQGLVCGFRPGSIYMLEELLRGQRGAAVLVLADNEAEVEAVHEAFIAHTQLVARNLMPARHALFEPMGSGAYRFSCPGDPAEAFSTVYVRAADWMESRHMVDLPHPEFGHVSELDVIVFVAERDGRSDSRTTTALLKLESLFGDLDIPHGRPRVVAEVFDARLAARLQAHCTKVGRHHTRIYSTQALRAFFLFQSVVVPGFDRVYSELLGSWGQSFVRFLPESSVDGPCSFAQMATELATRGYLLIGVELRDGDGHASLWVAPTRGETGAQFELSQLVSVWAIAPDRVTAAATAPVQ